MKKILLTCAGALLMSSSYAQTVIDTVSLGTGYANQKWYSLQNDEQGSSAKNNWDIAFGTGSQGSTIMINSVTGTMLWGYPTADTSGWNTLDTTGLSTWTPRYNSDTSWAFGAFSMPRNMSNSSDLGWGNYSSITHYVTADSLFVIKLANSTYKKLWIKHLQSGTYTFRYANLNGTSDTTVSLAKATYTGKNFGYYSLQNNIALDREPLSANWDLLFTQYTAFIPQPYSVTGVLSNKGLTAAKAYPVDTANVSWTSYTFVTPINTIGYNWKSYSGTWTIEDSLVYFAKTSTGNIWKLTFTGFGGSSNGNYIFSKKMISATGIEDVNGESLGTLALYPNPSSGENTTIVYSIDKSVSSAVLNIYDLSGRKIQSERLNNNPGFYQQQFSNQNLTAGMYLVSIDLDGNHIQQKLIIK
ncbi:MAG: hypothetical protein A3F72_16060 [Bacteroidetes bacterium RIFCSPLOWO2_12_FULL_35_15]|nr:MAG: hypothetical protein A3F72_16060 [Bacteroidetes bacterium RIFCSPLOWO2_12_FULL_35_15]